MKGIIISILFALSCSFGVMSQNTKANGRKLFNEGKYDEAKPIFEYLLKRNPKSAEYNYWYAVCCYETNDTVSGIEGMLKFAQSRRVLNASFYLGKFYKEQNNYPLSVQYYEEYLKIGKDEEKLAQTDTLLAHVKNLLRMTKATEQVVIIDSIVVDKNKFLAAYKAGRDIGRIYRTTDYLGENLIADGTVFVTERDNDSFYPRRVQKDSVELVKLFHATKNGSEWSRPMPLNGFDTGGNDNYPFMSADGATFYFASDGEGSIGGYDIFITRYDSESQRFLKPTNMGMPYNSEANDYMMVVNEIANIGWFATDRRMPEGKVCVYVFIPNSVRKTYNYEALGYEKMLSLSQIGSIADTQNDKEALRNAIQQLTMLRYEQSGVKDAVDFEFIIDDMTIYTSMSDFKSKEAAEQFKKWQKNSYKLSVDKEVLDKKRMEYSAGSVADKQRLAGKILNEENRLEEEEQLLYEMEKQIRKTEYEFINKK